MSASNELEALFRAEVFQKLEECGVDRTRVNVRYDDHLQYYAITISGPAEALNDEQYAAVVGAASSHDYLISFEDKAAAERFWRVAKAGEVDRTRRWLAAQGKLENLPLYDAAQGDLKTYIRTLEVHLGFSPGSIFEVRDVPGSVQKQLALRRKQDHEAIRMAVAGIVASNLREAGAITGTFGIAKE